LAGSKEFIQRALRNRKMLAGHIRQMGILAATGIVGLNKMIVRLRVAHENARILGMGLSDIRELNVNKVQTNKVLFDIKNLGIDTYEFLERLRVQNILGHPVPPTKIALTTHYGVNKVDIHTTVRAIKNIVKEGNK